jgi:hypothetical protein
VIVRKCRYSENDTTYAPSQFEREPFDTLIVGSQTNIISFSPINHALSLYMHGLFYGTIYLSTCSRIYATFCTYLAFFILAPFNWFWTARLTFFIYGGASHLLMYFHFSRGNYVQKVEIFNFHLFRQTSFGGGIYTNAFVGKWIWKPLAVLSSFIFWKL